MQVALDRALLGLNIGIPPVHLQIQSMALRKLLLLPEHCMLGLKCMFPSIEGAGDGEC